MQSSEYKKSGILSDFRNEERNLSSPSFLLTSTPLCPFPPSCKKKYASVQSKQYIPCDGLAFYSGE